MKIATEIVRMKTAEGVLNEDFVKWVDELEVAFHAKQTGYIDSELMFDEKKDEWVMIQHWSSMVDLKNASREMFAESITENFRDALDPKSVKMSTYCQIQTWNQG